MKKYTKGFTLIELLVVIAIIGILSSVVLVSLNTARNKGKDARIIANVQQLRTAFESGYTGSEYPDLDADVIAPTAGTSSAINQLASDLGIQGGQLIIRTDAALTTKYLIAGRLVSDTTKWFCLASDGSTNPATGTQTTTGGEGGC